MSRHKFNLLTQFKERFVLSKRQQFVIVTSILTTVLIATQLFSGGLRYDVLLGLAGIAYLLSALALRQDLQGWEYITLLILPTFYTVAVYLFYFLLPERWLVRLPYALSYALGMYAILLTENIYNVAAERNIQLLRAAHGVGFLLTLVTVFLLTNTLASLHLPYYGIGLFTLLIVFLLSLQSLWAIELTPVISVKVLLGSSIISLILTELSMVLSFWPLRTILASLFLTTGFYTLVGMTQQYLIERLFNKTIREFLIVFGVVLIIILIITSWGQGIQ